MLFDVITAYSNVVKNVGLKVFQLLVFLHQHHLPDLILGELNRCSWMPLGSDLSLLQKERDAGLIIYAFIVVHLDMLFGIVLIGFELLVHLLL